MHRLSVLRHHIIGNIHQIIDRTNPLRRESSLHPFRRRSDFNIFYNSCRITGTKIAVLYGYFNIIVYVFLISCFPHNRRLKFHPKRSGRLSGDSKHRITVYSVGSHFILEYRIVQSQRFHSVASDCSVRIKDINAKLRRFRIHITAGTQFFDGAHHTKRFHTAEFSLFNFNSARSHSSVMSARYSSAVQYNRHFISFRYVGSSCYNLQMFFRSDIHLADN